MDNFNYYFDNIHLLGIQGMNKKTIQSILERAQYFPLVIKVPTYAKIK